MKIFSYTETKSFSPRDIEKMIRRASNITELINMIGIIMKNFRDLRLSGKYSDSQLRSEFTIELMDLFNRIPLNGVTLKDISSNSVILRFFNNFNLLTIDYSIPTNLFTLKKDSAQYRNGITNLIMTLWLNL